MLLGNHIFLQFFRVQVNETFRMPFGNQHRLYLVVTESLQMVRKIKMVSLHCILWSKACLLFSELCIFLMSFSLSSSMLKNTVPGAGSDTDLRN